MRGSHKFIFVSFKLIQFPNDLPRIVGAGGKICRLDAKSKTAWICPVGKVSGANLPRLPPGNYACAGLPELA